VNAVEWRAVFGSDIWLWRVPVLSVDDAHLRVRQPGGLSLLNWIFLGCALAIDLGTWGIGFFASRQQVSN
jgi:hypothetical protein